MRLARPESRTSKPSVPAGAGLGHALCSSAHDHPPTPALAGCTARRRSRQLSASEPPPVTTPSPRAASEAAAISSRASSSASWQGPSTEWIPDGSEGLGGDGSIPPDLGRTGVLAACRIGNVAHWSRAGVDGSAQCTRTLDPLPTLCRVSAAPSA